MSNNVLMIVLGPDKKFRAYDRDALSGGSETIGPVVYPDDCGVGVEQPVFKVSTVEDAIREAQVYMKNNTVDYGYWFLNLPSENGEEKT